MAKISVIKKAPVVVEPKIESVSIDLTLDEAKQLAAIVGSGAGLVDGLYFKLYAAGIYTDGYVTNTRDGTIKVTKG